MSGEDGSSPAEVRASPVSPIPADAAAVAALDHSADLPTTPERVRSPRRDSIYAASPRDEPETSLGDEFRNQVDAARQALIVLRPPPEVPRPTPALSTLGSALSTAPS